MSEFTAEDVEIIEKTTPYRGYFRIDRYRVRHRLHDGGWSQAMTREVFERGHAAAVVPYDPARDTVVLIEQFRIGALAAGRRPWLVEVIAGIIEPGEDPANVVRREATEEAGCSIEGLELIGTVLLTPGGSSETLALYCGRVDSGGLGGVHGKVDEGEDIRVLVMPLDEALGLLASCRIVNANAVMALQWLALNRAELRRRWAADVTLRPQSP